MSFNIKGLSPCSNTEKYFGASSWTWRPLAELIKRLAPTAIVEKCKGWDYNDGKGLNAKDSIALAGELQKMIDDGLVKAYIYYRAGRLVTQPDGTTPSSGYTLTVSNVQEFADFLFDCGGFEIW